MVFFTIYYIMLMKSKITVTLYLTKTSIYTIGDQPMLTLNSSLFKISESWEVGFDFG